jgi:predicted phosphodiesterase
MGTISWLHLSDLHARDEGKAVERAVFDSMLKDIETQVEAEELDLDAVFFTGDLAFSGNSEQYKIAEKKLDSVLEACGLKGCREKLFIVPGNHDVNRQAVWPPHKAFAESLLSSDTYDEISNFLSAEEQRDWFFKRFEGYRQFVEAYYDGCGIEFDHSNYFYARSIEKGEHVFLVIGLNSAWSSFRDHEQGQLLLGEQQVCDAEERAQEKWPAPHLYIVLVHHPLYWLAEKDIHRVQSHLPRVCDILLRGHLHCPSYFVQRTPDWDLHEFAAGASWQALWHAYNLVALQVEDGQCEGYAISRFQHPDLSANWGPDLFTYQHSKEGRIALSLKLRG